MRLFLVLIFIACFLFSYGQEQPAIIEGTLVDGETNAVVAYASIGVMGYSLGTSSNTDGLFSLLVPAKIAIKNYSIKISCVGFENVIIENPDRVLRIRLKPSKTILREVIVFDKTLSPDKIVKRAFSSIKKNYSTKPFLSENFYRHYCKEGSEYGRLIEAAVDIYKVKGYKVQQPFAGWKDQVRVNQLRRTFDNSKVNMGHAPIALYSVMTPDIVGFQKKSEGLSSFVSRDVSKLKRNLKDFSFELEGITEFDGEKVYKISYHLQGGSVLLSTGILYNEEIKGTLFITTDRYAIVSAESTRKTASSRHHQIIHYKKLNGKYYPYHSMEEGDMFYTKENFTHSHHVELITTNIKSTDFQKFKGKQPDKETLLKIDYDSTFWENYNILKATPLEDSIARNLERKQKLKGQFVDFLSVERERYFSGKDDEERFNKFLESNKNVRPIYIDFWASWCGPCIKEMPAAMELVERYKGRIGFVYLSIDNSIEAWRGALKKFDLEKPFLAHHFRIGPNSDASILFNVTKIPRYILIDKKGNIVALEARRPSDDELKKELESLMAERIGDPLEKK